jgi:hypothetical protein
VSPAGVPSKSPDRIMRRRSTVSIELKNQLRKEYTTPPL